jgi:2'-5' RNA ligase
MRLFIAIPLVPTVIEELSAISRRLRTDQDGMRWSSLESWHVTLQFLGTTSPEQYSCVVARLRALHSHRVPIAPEGLGVFDRAGVFFAGVAVSQELLVLQQHVTAATAHCGFIPEARPFRPHVTLARTKGDGRGKNLRELNALIIRQPDFTPFVASEFLLYEAFLGPGGSHYEIRERFPLLRQNG